MEELCPQCKELGYAVRVEAYRNQHLERCTVHHWLINAEGRGWALDRYVETSEKCNFVCSLPTKEQIEVIRAFRIR
jgi:hypothetical protein